MSQCRHRHLTTGIVLALVLKIVQWRKKRYLSGGEIFHLTQQVIVVTSVSRVPTVPTVVAHDEIDLLALVQSVWRQKILIAAVALLAGGVAAAYAYSVTPEYEVSTVLRPAAGKWQRRSSKGIRP